MTTLVGREKEREILQTVLESPEAELVAVYGRRRVGKTFLVKESLKDYLYFSLTGVRQASLKEQLNNFEMVRSRSANSDKLTPPENWQEAFHCLTTDLEKLPKDQKHVIFFDELPWLASRNSRFLPAFDFFWNGWAADQSNLVVVICGSAASWMVNKVIRDKGGLHNRVTRRIPLQPFNLPEVKRYFDSRNVNLTRRQITEIYMIMGGIPHYLKEVRTGQSSAENIQDICFSHHGLLNSEFEDLYRSLFEHSDHHLEIVRALARQRRGLRRKDLVAQISLDSGGQLSQILRELEESGFIGSLPDFSGKKNHADLLPER